MSRRTTNPTLTIPSASGDSYPFPAAASPTATTPADSILLRSRTPSPAAVPTDTTSTSLNRPSALWAEMHQKLTEVELAGSSTRNIFFTPAHTKALSDLRTAQIALAQAWLHDNHDDDNRVNYQDAESLFGGDKNADVRKRRAANDAHFARVAEGVVDVARKLEDVARAMGEVEKESRGIWEEGSGDGSGRSSEDE